MEGRDGRPSSKARGGKEVRRGRGEGREGKGSAGGGEGRGGEKEEGCPVFLLGRPGNHTFN